jgi:DNA modification methylase
MSEREITVHGRAVEMVATGALRPFAANARVHSEEQLVTLERVIRDSGFTQPLIIDEANEIIAGHGRYTVAQRIGMTEVPCVRVVGLTPEQVRALRISDNQTALLATWDLGLLRAEIVGLGAAGFDLSLTALPLVDLRGLLRDLEAEADAEAPPLPARPVTRPGDVWILGDHRLICGDSTDAATVARLLDGAEPNLMVTDPPYGVNYDATRRQQARRGDGSRLNGGRGAAIGKVLNDERADWREAWALFPGDVAYVWHGDRFCGLVAESLQATGIGPRTLIVWVKSVLVISRGHYHSQHESCWYAVRQGRTGHWQGARDQSTVWKIDRQVKNETGHSTQKPVECMHRPIVNNSAAGEAIYDPFLGSGTTLIAAEMTARRLYAVELDPGYCDVAVLRWQAFAGGLAVLQGGGLYAAVAQARAKARKRTRKPATAGVAGSKGRAAAV